MPFISSADNPRVKLACQLKGDARARRAQGKFLLEGLRLCEDAVRSGFVPLEVFVCSALAPHSAITWQNMFEITEQVAKKLSDTQTPQGIFCTFALPEAQTAYRDFFLRDGCYLLLENAQDPANLGAVARTAEALGAQGLVLCGGCDPFSPKAQRAAMGSLLRIPLLQTEAIAEVIQTAKQLQCAVAASVPRQGATPVTALAKSQKRLLLLGNEGNGLTAEAIGLADELCTIPMRGRAESLNIHAAAAILLWEILS
ncbi:MAG: RNA methyltransferase [Oscillospiraceae bacterium]|jgi:TrmH family RNA methyltransferase|nr:RNA methyltransferase [Oscillospiraceae bacterium]